MLLEQLAQDIGARILSPGTAGSEIENAYAGNRISDLLNHAGEKTLLVTNLSGAQILCVAALLNVPAVCLLEGKNPVTQLLELAESSGIAILVSTMDMQETCLRLGRCLKSVERAR